MKEALKLKFKTLAMYLLDQLQYSSTWQGIAFLATFAGAKFGVDLNIAGATAAGSIMVAVIKIFLPDSWKKVG